MVTCSYLFLHTLYYQARYIFLLAGFLISFTSTAITNQCISVGQAGDVTVNWNTSGTSSANFRCWYVYHSVSGFGPFTAVDSNFIFTDTSSFDPLANAYNNPAYYVIAFKSNNGTPDILSDTIHAINLILNNSGGSANLSWNATHTPLNPDDSPYYLIYREYPMGTFTLLDSVDARVAVGNMTFHEVITICNDTIKYHIEVHNSAGCISSSASKGDRFQDSQPPTIPPIDSVTVDALGNIIVSWQVSPSADTKKYIVLQQTATGVVSVDTVVGINNTTLQTTISGAVNSQSFFILAVDNCNNISSPSSVHTSIFASSSFDRCDRAAQISWSAYDFWGTPPRYDILVSVNGGAETVAGSTNNTSFTDSLLTSGTNTCYRIRAVDIATGRTTTSNRTCISPSFPPAPSFSYIRKATVVSDNEINIIAYVDAGGVVSGYELYRASAPTGPFSLISTLNISSVATISFTDNVEAAKGPYYYYITSIDSCGKAVLVSQTVRTMVLTAQPLDHYINSMEWSEYAGWPTGIETFNLLLNIDGVTTVIPLIIPILPPYSYLDSVIDNFYSQGHFCYTIQAVEESGNPFSYVDSALSNSVCVDQPPMNFIPNAFHPGGNLNDVFYAYNSFVPVDGYSLNIYNRWGELIFHSEDPFEGWPGTFKGKACPEGVYIYKLICRNGKKEDIEKTGSVTLIR